jgi:allantoicase
VFLPHEYTDRGKWMDGWESRRKRIPEGDTTAHDWAIVRLGVPGVLRGVVVDTAFFRGNFPSHCSLEGCAAPTDARLEDLLSPATEWVEILPRSPLEGDSKNRFAIGSPFAFTHVRLRIFPDGGVARLRLFGDAVPDWRRIGHARGELDLAGADHGAHVLACSDMFFGERRNLIMPDRALNMGDGWETKRRRGPGSDWAIVRLAARGAIGRVVVDTHHFKGNFPDTCSIEACDAPPGATVEELGKAGWRELLPRTKLQADTRHGFESELSALGPVTHVRLNVFPDGGVSRFRVYGTLDAEARRALGLRRLDTLPPPAAERELRACCASTKWIAGVLARRPFGSATALFEAADAVWSTTGESDWREAFAGHPRIGETPARTSAHGATASAWSSEEQSGTRTATDETRAALAEINRAYEERYGFRYIVCATGRGADEMLAIARSRMQSDPSTELRTAAAELHKITRLRLEKLLEP